MEIVERKQTTAQAIADNVAFQNVRYAEALSNGSITLSLSVTRAEINTRQRSLKGKFWAMKSKTKTKMLSISYAYNVLKFIKYFLCLAFFLLVIIFAMINFLFSKENYE